jgi:putative flippase GtrA
MLVTRIKKLLGLKSVRYIISGGAATGVDILAYYVCIHYVFSKETLYLNRITAPIASLIVSYSCGFCTNFTISKLFVFKNSTLRTRYQLLRYVLVAFIVFVLNYFLMKMFIGFNLYPTVSRIFSVCLVAIISYLLHNRFTFKTKRAV